MAETTSGEDKICAQQETAAIQSRLNTLLKLALAIGKREGLIGRNGEQHTVPADQQPGNAKLDNTSGN